MYCIGQEFGFEEIFLIHNHSTAESRNVCDPSVIFGGCRFKLPVVPANMASVVNEKTCEFLARNDYFYIMHRFAGHDPVAFTERMHKQGLIASISIGVNDDSKAYIDQLVDRGLNPEFITIDVANVWSSKGEHMIKYVKDKLQGGFLIAGNVASEEGVIALEEWGADATKVGIANGGVCTTYYATGVGRPQFSTVLKCAALAKKPVISDGGIRNVGDICKAMVAGASMVMGGTIFSGYDESAGEVIDVDGKKCKLYFGSASWSNTRKERNVEGKCIMVPVKGKSMSSLMDQIEDGLRSCISYAGGLNLDALSKMKWGYRIGGLR